MQPRTNRRKRTIWAIIIIILLAIWGIHRYGSLNGRLQNAWNKVIYTSNDNVGIAVYSPKTRQVSKKARSIGQWTSSRFT